MQVRDDIKEAKIEHITAVLTGNGRKEFRILRPFGERHDGKDKILFFPVRSQPFKGSGLKALKAIKPYLWIYKIEKFLFIVDKEAIKEEALTEIGNILTENGITVLDIRPFLVEGEDSLFVTCSIGSHEVIINIAINGRVKKVEENIIKLIELEYDRQISPNEIKRTLKELGITLEILLRRARKKNIELSFPSLNLTLTHIEEYT